MDTTEMLNKMCHLELTVVDIKALCKSRGFTSKEANSRNLLEGFFLSETGVHKQGDGVSRGTPMQIWHKQGVPLLTLAA